MHNFNCKHQHRHSLQCIIPDYILESMATHQSAKVRDAVARTLAASRSIRDNRQALGQLAQFESKMLATPAGVQSAKQRSIYTADNSRQLRARLLRREGDDPSGDSAVDNVYDFFGITYDFYNSVYHRNSIDDAGMPMIGTVHFDIDLNNAFWNGREMAFGDGDQVLFNSLTQSLDVIGHELSHGVVQFNGSGGLLYFDQSGALNESISDVFGVLVKQYSLNQNVTEADWLIGAEVLVSAPSLRNMKDPHLGLGISPNGTPGQPKHMSEYDNTFLDNRGVHINSGIPNHAFYQFATRLGGYAWLRAGQVWYDTLTKGNLPSGMDASGYPKAPFTTFQLFADKTMAFTQSEAERNALAQSWADVGIMVSCAPFVPIVDGGGRELAAKLEAIRKELDSVIDQLR